MKKMVLIIDDDDAMLDVLADRIESMGYDYEPADCQHVATELLRKRRYDLILLDQELPTRKGKPTSKQVGRNLLAQIREDGLNQKTPVIIVTAHDGTDPMVACDFMHHGADYFLPKPSIDLLESKIRLAFQSRSEKERKASSAPSPAKTTLKSFTGGKLEFQADGVYLGEIRLATPSSTIGRILRELAKQAASGKRRGCSSKALADRLGLTRGSQAITEAVSPFRRQVIEEMNKLGFEADSDNVIATGKGGYELARNIEAVGEFADSTPEPTTDPSSAERVAWFITEAEAGRKPCKALYMQKFPISASTWKRDLVVLTNTLEPVGVGAATYYRPKKRTASKSG